MAIDTGALERRAIEFAKLGNFGTDALEANRELTVAAPANQGAWTRLARCCMEQQHFEDAAAALIKALELNPSNSIAKSLHQEVIRRRAMAPVRSDAASGFTPQDFYTLGQLAPTDAARVLGAKFESLLMSLNEQRTAARIVDARNRAGLSGSKLFRRNSFYPGQHGHMFAFHHGGRWEPQFNLGMFSQNPWGVNALRMGIGFNMSPAGSDPDREAGQASAIAWFERFQQALDSTWRGHLVDWMSNSSGFIQYGDRGPATGPHAQAGRGLGGELPQSSRNRVGLRRTMVVPRQGQRCGNARSDAIARRRRRGHVRGAVSAVARGL